MADAPLRVASDQRRILGLAQWEIWRVVSTEGRLPARVCLAAVLRAIKWWRLDAELQQQAVGGCEAEVVGGEIQPDGLATELLAD